MKEREEEKVDMKVEEVSWYFSFVFFCRFHDTTLDLEELAGLTDQINNTANVYGHAGE